MDIRVEDNNLLSYKNWSGLTCGDIAADSNGSYWNDYAGAGTTNCRILDIDPFGNSNYIWNSSSTGATTYGGFNISTGNYQYIPCDPTKDYRFSCWFNRKVIINTKPGAFYFGCWATSGTTAINVQDKISKNYTNTPYFVNKSTTIVNTNQDEWYLLVGYLYKVGTITGGTVNSSMYNLSGVKITGYTYQDFINNSLVTDLTIKIAPIYEASGCTAYIAYPRIDLVDGTEPSISTLLQNEGMWRSGTTYIRVEDNNLVDHSDWYTPITGSTAHVVEIVRITSSYVNSKNYIENDIGPHGIEVPIWKTQGFATGYTAGIGYTYDTSGALGTIVDNTKMYRFSIWVNRKDIGTSGEFYFGYNVKKNTGGVGNSIRINDGLSGTNFYFIGRTFAQAAITLPENNWVLAVGYLLPSTYTGGTDANYYNKIYSTSGTILDTSAFNYKMNGDTYGVYLRCYTPYNETTWSGTTSWLYNPRIDLVDGTEPSIATLLSNEGMWKSGTTMIYVDDVWKNT